jgi:DNA-directed RNA polymerase specialized sigma24 family protein
VQSVIGLGQLEDCSYREIAVITAIPIGTIMFSRSLARCQSHFVLDHSGGTETLHEM